ncbi:histidine kinase [Chryseobacterium soli]|uniref:sensor histidine kinase n=1 Tax=Chryseobacterium soli TaxID=445961 RepID=UPI002954CCE4|nr:histidine kinase [Chryseobacterium soli]MDV7699344.1 histidine kinase [Chryseobacterium soli]
MVNYNEEDGLNSSYTYRFSQDNNGLIWIGSDNGLFRFDGKEFKQYTKKNGLKNIEVLSCFPLSNGEIFISPFLSDYAFLKDGKIINSDVNKELKKIHFNYNPNVYIQNNNLYLYTSYNPEAIYVYSNGKISTIPLFIKNGNPSGMYYAFNLDLASNLMYFVDENAKKNIEAYNIITHKRTVCNISLEKNTPAYSKGNFYIFRHNNKVEVYKLYNSFYFKKIQSFSVRENIHQIIIDKNYRVWLCLEQGGALYFKHSLLDNVNLSHPIKFLDKYIINDIMVDRDNNTWFSTRNNGIYFITEKALNNYIHLPVSNNTDYITAIEKNGNTIFLGYNEAKSGIYHANTITDLVFEKDRKIEHKAIFSEGNTTIFGLTGSLIHYNTATKKKFLLKEYSLKNLLPYTPGSVLICSSEGLTAYNYQTRTYEELVEKERMYTALLYDKDSLFTGSFKDLYKLNTRTKKKNLFLEGYYFTDIKKLRHNLYVGATNLSGIILFNNRKILQKITENNGLATSHTKKIEIENQNVFWASTNSGLSRIEIRNQGLRINNFTQTDGLPSNVIAGCVIRGDTLYAGTSKGLGILSIKNLLAQQKFIDKKVIINSVVIGNKEFFNLNTPLVGKTPNNDITFNVSFPDYASQGNISYQYTIEGLSDGWQTSNSSKIIFNAIPPGTYTFKVFGLGYNGKQSFASTNLSFEIKPKFWQTWWFKLVLIILGSAVIFILITLYFQKKRNKKLETLYYEKKIAELELQAIKAQINPHFIYNCLNSIQFLLYKKDYKETENYLDIFAQMIRKTLHYSEKTFMPVKEEIEYLSLYLHMEHLRLKDQFDYKITVSEATNENWIIPSLLIQPFVENAIKHGISNIKDRKGNIEIIFDVTGTSLCITVEDNGVGIGSKNHSSPKPDSFGVKLSQKRIETFKQLFDMHIMLEINDLREKEQRPGTQIKLYIIPYEN